VSLLVLLVLSPFLAACSGPTTDLRIPSAAWQAYYEEEIFRNEAIGNVRYLGFIDENYLSVSARALGAGKPEGVDCSRPTPSSDYCTLQAEYTSIQGAYLEARQAYNDARAKWNAWIATVVLIISSNSNIEDWTTCENVGQGAGTCYQRTAQDAAAAATAFFHMFPPADQRLAADKLNALDATARRLAPQVYASVPSTGAARGGAPAAASGPSLSLDPLSLVQKVFDMVSAAQADREKLSTDARTRISAQLTQRQWDEYDCILGTSACRQGPQQVAPPVKPGGLNSASPVRALVDSR